MYMSPEQARGETVDGASDLFSLGLVLVRADHGADTRSRPIRRSGVLHAVVTDGPVPAGAIEPGNSRGDGRADHANAGAGGAAPAHCRAGCGKADRDRGESPGARAGRRPLPRMRAIVGRGDERGCIADGFDAAAAGYGSMVCVTGEPGLGKTTLVEAFLDELANAGQRGCSRAATAQSGWPVPKRTCRSWRRWTALLYGEMAARRGPAYEPGRAVAGTCNWRRLPRAIQPWTAW